jgi:anti-anti-sigma factor
MPSLLIDVVSTPPVTLVTIFGEVDLATIAQFRECLETLPDHDTVIELSDVALLSAVGMRALLDRQDRLASVGARLVLAAVSRPVRRVLSVTGLDTRLLMVPTVMDGLDALSGTRNQSMSTPEW